VTNAHLSENPELLLSHADFMRALARSLLHDEHLAEDVVQDAWMAALGEPQGGIKKVRAWLAGTVRNLSLKKLRTEKRNAHKARVAADSEPIRSPEEMMERETARRRVVDAVGTLDEPYRSVILYRYYDDMPPRTIARLLDIPVETVKTRIQRGLKRMRAQLDASYDGDRKAWCVALAPLVGIEVAATSTGVAVAASIATGAFAMSLKTKILITASVALLLGLTCTVLFTDDDENTTPLVPVDQVVVESGEPAVPEKASLEDDAYLVPLRPDDDVVQDAMPESFAEALGGVKGRLVEEDGTPIPHTSVGIVGGDFFDLLRDTGALAWGGPYNLVLKEVSARTQKDGTFFFSGVYPRSFYVFWADSGGPRAFARVLDKLPEPGGTADLGDFALPPYVTFCGAIVGETGKPVPGARIRATNLPPLVLVSGLQDFGRGGSFLVEPASAGGVVDPPPVVHDLLDRLPLSTTWSASDGSFCLDGVPIGLAHVIVDHDDFATLSCGPFATGRSGQKDIGDLVLLEGYTVTGVVVDHEGTPLRGIEVRAGSVRAFKKLTVLKPPVKTDTRGAFRVGALSTESAMVAVRRYAKDRWTVVGPLLIDDEPVNITLPSAYDLKIKVVTESGTPIDGAGLKIRSDYLNDDIALFNPPRVPKERMDQPAQGIFVINDLPSGKYECLVTAPGYAAIHKKVTVIDEAIEKKVVLEPAFSARVRVVDAVTGAPVEWAEVHATIGRSDWFRKQYRLSRCRTDVEGRGLLEHLRPGKYTITVSHPGYALSFGSLETPADQETVLIVEQGGSIEGVVNTLTDEWTAPFMIVLQQKEWRHAPGGEAPRITVTDLEGRFRMTHLTPGERWVNVLPRVFARSPAEFVSRFNLGSIRSVTERIEAGETTYLELTVGEINVAEERIQETGAVSGRVLVDRIPAVGVDVEIRSGADLSTRTGSDGGYSFPDVPVGKHFLFVSRKLGTEESSYSSIFRSIEVEPNLTPCEDFNIRTGSLSGCIVRSGSLSPVRDSRLLAICTDMEKSNDKVIIPIQTKEDGSFDVDGIPTGTYCLSTGTSLYSYTPVHDIKILPGKHTGPVLLEQPVCDLVAGRIVLTDEMGKARGLELHCFSSDDRLWRTFSLVVSTGRGAFETTDMPPGHYVVRLGIDMDGLGLIWSEHEDMTLDIPEGGITGVVLKPVER
jgi:RNA polymerase sigma factor (sigma-70 family)